MPTIESKDHILFYRRDSWLSNHYPAPFMVKGKQFYTVEQFYFYCGALICGDKLMAEAILNEPDPAKNKMQGNFMQKYHADEWEKKKIGIMRIATYQKYHQNEALFSKLMATGDKKIIEASPSRFWGIGIDINDSKASIEGFWRGKNMLGNIIMDTREILRGS